MEYWSRGESSIVDSTHFAINFLQMYIEATDDKSKYTCTPRIASFERAPPNVLIWIEYARVWKSPNFCFEFFSSSQLFLISMYMVYALFVSSDHTVTDLKSSCWSVVKNSKNRQLDIWQMGVFIPSSFFFQCVSSNVCVFLWLRTKANYSNTQSQMH